MKRAFNSVLLENKKVAKDTYLLKFRPLMKIHPEPGQFFMVSKEKSSFFLKRPISVHYFYDDGNFKLLIRKKGHGTSEIVNSGFNDVFSFIGPIGNGFPIDDKIKRVAVIAGGIGIAPFALLLKELHRVNVICDLYYGEKDKGHLIEYWRHSNKCIIATDNGTEGSKGTILDLFEKERYDRIYMCGPDIMFSVFFKRYPEYSNKTFVSMERHMACGMGACMGCNIETKTGIKYVCKDGPVFILDEIF